MKIFSYDEDLYGLAADLHVAESVENLCSLIGIEYYPNASSLFYFDRNYVAIEEDQFYDIPEEVMRQFTGSPVSQEDFDFLAVLKPSSGRMIDLKPYIIEEEITVDVIDLSRSYSTLDSLSKVYRPQNEKRQKNATYTVNTTDSFFDIEFD